MKKVAVIILFFLIAGLLGAGFFLYRKNERTVRTYPPLYRAGERPMTDYVPDGAAVVVFIKGIGETWARLSHTNFFHQLGEYGVSPFISAMARPRRDLGYPSRLRHFLLEEIFLSAFGEDVSLAVMPSSSKKGKSSFLVITKTGPLFPAEEFLLSLYRKYFGKGATAEYRLGDFTAKALPKELAGSALYYSVIRGAMLISDSLDTLRLGLGIAEGREIPRLIDAPVYQKSVGKALATTRYGVFVDAERLRGSSPASGGAPRGAGPILISMFSRAVIRDAIRVQTEYFTHPEGMAKLGKGGISPPPGPSKALSFFPGGTILFFDAQGLKPGGLARNFAGDMGERASLAKGLLSFSLRGKNGQGTSWKEFLPLLGNEWSFALLENGKSEAAPPCFAVAAEVTNVPQTKALIEKIAFSGKAPAVEKRRYKEIAVNRVPGIGKAGFEYFFLDKFLIAGTNAAGINAIIDTLRQDAPSLGKSRMYTVSAPESHLIFLLNNRKLIHLLKTAAQAIPQGLSGFQAKGPSLGEVLNLAGVLDFAEAAAVFTPERIRQKTRLALRDLPSVQKRTSSPQRTEIRPPAPGEKLQPPVAPVKKGKAPVPGRKGISAPPLRAKVARKTTPQAKQSGKNGVRVKMEAAPEKADVPEFVYRSRYRGRLRPDPFDSPLEHAIDREAAKVNVLNLRKELKTIQQINMYLYRRARKEDPRLTRKIEYFTEYFKDTKRLARRTEAEVTKKAREYAATVEGLNAKYGRKYISPLNFDLGSLRLVGVIAGAVNNVALVEASDGKGYSLRTGDIVGTNYGKIVSVSGHEVRVRYEMRNYKGEISRKTKSLRLKKEED